MVQVDGAESGGPVDPGVACWVGMSGEPDAREERGMSAWQFALMNLPPKRASIHFDRTLSIRLSVDLYQSACSHCSL